MADCKQPECPCYTTDLESGEYVGCVLPDGCPKVCSLSARLEVAERVVKIVQIIESGDSPSFEYDKRLREKLKKALIACRVLKARDEGV